MKLITETVEEVKYITEENNGVKTLYIQGPFLVAETKNRNGRSYPVTVLENEVNRYMKEYVDKNRAFGELGHPESPTINLERVSHMITNIKRNGNVFEGKAKGYYSLMFSPCSVISREGQERGQQRRQGKNIIINLSVLLLLVACKQSNMEKTPYAWPSNITASYRDWETDRKSVV